MLSGMELGFTNKTYLNKLKCLPLEPMNRWPVFTHIHVVVIRLLTMVILVLPMSVSWSQDQAHQWYSFLTLLRPNAEGDWGSSMEADASDSCLLTRCDADEKWQLYNSILNQASAQLLPSEITIVSKQILNNFFEKTTTTKPPQKPHTK